MKKPTVPGYYWARWPDGFFIDTTAEEERWTVVKIEKDVDDPDHMEVYAPGVNGIYGVSQFIKFIGPITRPGETAATVTVKYWSLHSWPYSIDQSPMTDDKEFRAIEVSPDEIRTKNGKRYYRMVCGHGEYVDLLVDENVHPDTTSTA